jgi:uncharacterized protein YbjT (DUF2867 family)
MQTLDQGNPVTQKLLLLTGANGRTGRAVLKSLVNHGVAVRAFVRNPAHQQEMLKLGATQCVVGDFQDSASVDAALQGAVKVLHIGPPMHADEVAMTGRFIDAAKRNSAAHFIYYSVMHPIRREVRHHRLKLDCEEALIESGLPYTILQPSRYMQHLVPIWKSVIADGVHAMPFDITRRFSIVDLADLADACAVVASSGNHHFATYELAGPEALSQEDMARIISEILGRTVTARATPPEAVAAKARAAGFDDDRIEQMLLMNRHYDAHGFRGNPNVLQYLIGRPARSFKSYVKQLAAEIS